MKAKILLWIAVVALLGVGQTEAGPIILSLDGSRTGDESEAGGDRYLTSPAMSDATNILVTAGFGITLTDRFTAANIAAAGAQILYTGTVDVGFIAPELTDIQAFVSSGGGLVIQRDWDSFYPAADPLAAIFGITYNPGPFGIVGTSTAVNQAAPHPIWSGPAGIVTSYYQVYSASVTGGTSIGIHSTDLAETALAVLSHGLGRVVFLTDMDAWDNDDTVSPIPGSNNAIVWENIFHWATPTAEPIPEPSTILLLGTGLVGLVGYGWRHRKS